MGTETEWHRDEVSQIDSPICGEVLLERAAIRVLLSLQWSDILKKTNLICTIPK